MLKILLLGLLIFILLISYFNLVSPAKIVSTTSIESPSAKTEEILFQAKDSLNQSSKKTVSSFKEEVYQNIKITLDKIFDRQNEKLDNPPQPVIAILGVSVESNQIPSEQIHQVDLSSGNILKLNIATDKKYYFQFKNLSSDDCLFVNEEKQTIKEGQIVELEFRDAGTYKLKTAVCNIDSKEVAEFKVE